MKYLLPLLLVFSACSSEKVSFCSLWNEDRRWLCTRAYRASDNPNEVIDGEEDLVSCHKFGAFPWECNETKSGLTLKDPTPFMSETFFVIIPKNRDNR